MVEQKYFYRSRLVPCGDGLIICTDRFTSLKETEQMHLCVMDCNLWLVSSCANRDKCSPIKAAKDKKVLKRIHKSRSRIAFDSEQKALENLIMLKRKQLMHFERDTAFIRRFLKETEDVNIEDIPTPHTRQSSPILRVLDNTQDLVLEYLRFE